MKLFGRKNECKHVWKERRNEVETIEETQFGKQVQDIYIDMCLRCGQERRRAWIYGYDCKVKLYPYWVFKTPVAGGETK